MKYSAHQAHQAHQLDSQAWRSPPAPATPVARSQSPLAAALQTLWQSTIQRMTNQTDLRVWQTSDRHGNTVWNAHDPQTNRGTYGVTEPEVRRWIDQRHHHQPDQSL